MVWSRQGGIRCGINRSRAESWPRLSAQWGSKHKAEWLGAWGSHLIREGSKVNEQHLALSLWALITEEETVFCLFTIGEWVPASHWMWGEGSLWQYWVSKICEKKIKTQKRRTQAWKYLPNIFTKYIYQNIFTKNKYIFTKNKWWFIF